MVLPKTQGHLWYYIYMDLSFNKLSGDCMVVLRLSVFLYVKSLTLIQLNNMCLTYAHPQGAFSVNGVV